MAQWCHQAGCCCTAILYRISVSLRPCLNCSPVRERAYVIYIDPIALRCLVNSYGRLAVRTNMIRAIHMLWAWVCTQCLHKYAHYSSVFNLYLGLYISVSSPAHPSGRGDVVPCTVVRSHRSYISFCCVFILLAG